MFGLITRRQHEKIFLEACDRHNDEVFELTGKYQDLLDAEYARVVRLCRMQLHRWAVEGFYELFTTGPTALTGARLRAMFDEAEKMLSPERLRLAE